MVAELRYVAAWDSTFSFGEIGMKALVALENEVTLIHHGEAR